jgi:hypothetical protein
MKRLLIIFYIILCTEIGFSQNHIYILVDISKSITQEELTKAKQTLFEVMTGSNLTNAFVSAGKSEDLKKFKLTNGDNISISNFGNLQTSLSINPNPLQFKGNTDEFTQYLNSIDWTPKDNQTYYTLAKAKIAEYSKNHGIDNYKLYILSDNIQDDYGAGGKPSYPNIQVQNLTEGYNTSTNVVSESGSTKLKFSASSNFALTFIPKVDISHFTLTTDNTVVAPSITLTSLADGTKNNPKSVTSKAFTISWNCNCPADTKFNVALTQIDGGNYRDLSKKNIVSNSVKFSDVPSGKYKIVVSTPDANSAMTYIQIPSSGLGLWIVLLLFLAGGITGYYFWNKKRQEKIEAYSTDQSEDIFTKGTGTTSNSANTDYF